MGKKRRLPTDGYAPLTLTFEEGGKVKLLASLDFPPETVPAEKRVRLRVEGFGGRVRLLDRQMNELNPELATAVPFRSFAPQRPRARPGPRKPKARRVFPTSIAYLSTLPRERCGVATYTDWLAKAVSKHYHVGIFRNIRAGVPEDALIHAQCEFGIFQDWRDLVSEEFEGNYKICTIHTVLRDPHPFHLEYYQALDEEYDAFIVHTALGKQWLSRYVSKPVYLIPHGSLLWDPIPRDEARKRLGLPLNAEIAFGFGFAAETKGFDEAIEAAGRIKRPKFRLVVSGSPHGILRKHTEREIRRLKRMAGKNAMVLGRYLGEDEINLWASASDVLVFNYKTPPFVASASGALKRVLAAGRPIVCVDDNRLEELVAGQHALKFRAGDLDEFAHAIEVLLEDREIAERLGRNCRILAEQTSWDRVAERHMDLYGKIVGGFDVAYYDDPAYFDVGVGGELGKPYRDPGGELKRWGYVQLSTVNWLGWRDVVRGLKEVFNPKRLLDVGTGVGGMVHYAREAGIEARGCDFSRYAVEHPFGSARGFLDLADARELPYPDRSFDLLTYMDIMEHIYEEDLPRVVSEAQRVSSRYIFYNISVAGEGEPEIVLERGRLPPKDVIPSVVPGHVNVRREGYWRRVLANEKWRLRDDLVERFRKAVPEEVIKQWRCIIVTERVG
ncbi:MAG: glycosyltransferase [Deltaproteobacteria bacterium]|nr:glycosyltransferase [Deltaproteobacteria bacterium]